ncbi:MULTISPECIES: DUF2188 domain-containing protein [Pseudomonas syringae group]|uniref:DUF2188 domain-containing protein n=1 Tax=Pseudomonas syringae group TaxID=136849 RepID=UPI000EFE3200|nr:MULTISPECIES: DUF2188 domain-containing protein [Pseudomonas syringae group]RMV62571.1 hypothetical protein ALP08_00439 [Pseudomonas syringae pv. pisi]UPT38527.1 DUF2188 domain-containing protein [Pseudomonas amygdali pv. loropetali]
MRNYHVVPTEQGWELHIEGSNDALLQGALRNEVVEQLTGYMRGKAGSVKIHTRDDRLEEQRIYMGIDPPGSDK